MSAPSPQSGAPSDERDWDRLVGDRDTVRRVFDEVPVMVCAFEGPRHTYVAANAAYRAEYPKLAAMGASLRDLAPEVEGQAMFEAFDRVYETGEPLTASEWRVHADIDGDGVLQERYFDMVIAPRRDAEGTVIGLHVTVTNVTERVQARLAEEARAAELSDRYVALRNSAQVMQKALLAAAVPVLPGVDIAAEYLVATEDTAAGGDWFDAIPVPGGVVLVVGDVVGHGIEAAAAMAQLRAAVRMAVLSGREISETLRDVDAFSGHVPGGRYATLCVGRLDAEAGTFEYCTAGHPPPLRITAAGQPQFLPASGDAPLGRDSAWHARTERVDPGDVILLYSDGIIERPGRELSSSSAEFARLAAGILAGGGLPLDGLRPVERLCGQTIELLLRETGYGDDVTLLAAQHRAAPAKLALELPADPHAGAAVRAALREWLAALGADDADVVLVEHAVSEYVDNSAEHAYADGSSGTLTVDGVLDGDGHVRITVTDRGRWQERGRRPRNRGRGLRMAEALVTHTSVVHDDRGTVATATHRLERPARIVTDQHRVFPRRPTAAEFAFAMDVDDVGGIALCGDVGTVDADRVATTIAAVSRAGTRPVRIDLQDVTHLGSTALGVLADALDRAAQNHTECTLLARPGSAAHRVLTLVNLPITADE
ncbi:PAS domain S-box protein [Mycobacterium sp. PS03-16]|uniref:SpoIIE family protein phosphatase n=1 Tax=Mycobacterium sp. PS03-16 TaxID=2559611 RepID=UPI0010731A46|nr:SpoIIE family protein phosphatase [Mycobacterium sp. PS03-16]TFV55859.1 PAS domain S-box protein [Mycobacterium sp. PS03-16]